MRIAYTQLFRIYHSIKSSLYFCICEADIYAIAHVPYRMLAHSHSATSLYNLSQSAIMLHRVRHLTCERAWFCLVLFRCLYCVCHFGTDFGFKHILILSWFLNWLSCFLAILLAKLFLEIIKCLWTWKFILIWYVVKYHMFLLHV
jgi:hypothetical protein